MNVRGAHDLDAPRDAVFGAILDPRVLLAVIPGCESVEQVGPDAYEASVLLRLPGAVGRYRTSVRLVDAVPPERAGLDGRVEGSMGSIVGRADFRLEERAAGCRLEYGGRATIHGPLARLDSRFAERLAESLIAQGLAALDRRLAAEPGPGRGSEPGPGRSGPGRRRERRSPDRPPAVPVPRRGPTGTEVDE